MTERVRILRISPHFQRSGTCPVAFDPCGGLQVQTRRMTLALDQAGVHQTVLTSHIPGARRVEQLSDRIQVLSVGPSLPAWAVSWALALTWGLAVLVGLWRHRTRTDLIHIHFNHWLTCRLLVIAARVIGKPTVVTFSTQLWVAQQNPVIRRVAQWIDGISLRCASHVIALTNGQAQQARDDFGLQPQRLSVIPDAIDAPAFRGLPHAPDVETFRQRHRIPGTGVVLYLGRIRAEKGWHDLPDLARALGSEGFLLICGDGPDRAQLTDALERICPQRNWCITGFVDQTGARTALEIADVLVLPSRREAFGSVLLEALACGVPTVANRVGGIPELAGKPAAIRLVEPGDISALAGAVRGLFDQPTARDELAKRGLARVEDFALADAAKALMSVYSAVGAAADVEHGHADNLANPNVQAGR